MTHDTQLLPYILALPVILPILIWVILQGSERTRFWGIVSLFTFLITTCSALDATAQESPSPRPTLYLGAHSYHSSPTPNSVHNLVAFEYRSWGVGTFKNSYGEQTHFISHAFTLPSPPSLAFRLHLAASRGYETCFSTSTPGPWCPLLYFELHPTWEYPQPSILFTHDTIVLTSRLRF